MLDLDHRFVLSLSVSHKRLDGSVGGHTEMVEKDQFRGRGSALVPITNNKRSLYLLAAVTAHF